MADCSHDCGNCSENCSSRITKLELNRASKVDKIIGVVSGKGGVGKSFVSSLLAVKAAQKGYDVGLLDADITGPSIPKCFGLNEKAYGDGELLYPIKSSKLGIDIISSNMLLENEDDPIIWRGTLISSLVSQFYSDTLWGEKDYLFIDMPPGTGDVALTVFQSIPLDAIVIVATPSQLVSTIVNKAVKMAKEMNIPIVGVVENMAYVTCPDCNNKIYIYGKDKLQDALKPYGLEVINEIPLDLKNAELVDQGRIEDIDTSLIEEVFNRIEDLKHE